MKLLSYKITGLQGNKDDFYDEFRNDLNIVTGKNGAGKTSFLKLIWYVISGNIELALSEVNFKLLQVSTDLFDITLAKYSENQCRIELDINGKRYSWDDYEERDNEEDFIFDMEDAATNANGLISELGTSVFFPTFRRIEGGFSIPSSVPMGNANIQNSLSIRSPRKRNEVEEALANVSRRLSNPKHSFVTSISTNDIVTLLLTKYSNFSEEASKIQQSVSAGIINDIVAFSSKGAKDVGEATSLISKIRDKIERMQAERVLKMKPIEAIHKLVEMLFENTGIRFGQNLNFGDAATAINSDALSAGEKQMLSFICYNAFQKDSIIFIDEPELSLHVDWQRQLFAILMEQQSTNQFIIATHSPFIYSKYPDKEIQLCVNRGDSGLSN